jgi:hypothetical protein
MTRPGGTRTSLGTRAYSQLLLGIVKPGPTVIRTCVRDEGRQSLRPVPPSARDRKRAPRRVRGSRAAEDRLGRRAADLPRATKRRSERYDRAAVRWLGRFALEGQKVTIRDLRGAADALDMLSEPEQREARSHDLGVCEADGYSIPGAGLGARHSVQRNAWAGNMKEWATGRLQALCVARGVG